MLNCGFAELSKSPFYIFRSENYNRSNGILCYVNPDKNESHVGTSEAFSGFILYQQRFCCRNPVPNLQIIRCAARYNIGVNKLYDNFRIAFSFWRNNFKLSGFSQFGQWMLL